MARIRSIKPEFWTSAQNLECSTNARLMFIGIWNFADDSGRHPWSPKQVKAEVFPSDDFSERQILGWLQELENNRLIRRYSFENVDYFYITGWHNQKIDRPQPAKYPDPFGERSTTDQRTFAPDRIGEDRKGKDTISCAVAGATRTKTNLEFEEFWKNYPKRQGSNPKQPAKKKFEAAVKSGVSPAAIISAVKSYAAQERKLEHIGTPFIAMAKTWLNQQRYSDYQPQQNPTGPPAGLTPEQRAAWVRKQMETENDDQKGTTGSAKGGGELLATGEGFRQA